MRHLDTIRTCGIALCLLVGGLATASQPASAQSSECVECGFGADDANRISELTLRYLGPTANVTVYDSKVRNNDILFAGMLTTGQTFTVRASTIGSDRIGSKILLFAGDVQLAEIHTSCSAPVFAGLTEQTQPKAKDPNGVADFEIVGGRDRNGRDLCDGTPPPPPPPPPPPGDDCVECGTGADDGEKLRELTLRYMGDPGVVRAYRKDKVKAENLLFEGFLNTGDTVVLSAAAINERDLGSKVGFYRGGTSDGDKIAEIHTSCSAPVIPQVTTEANQPKGEDPNGEPDFLVLAGVDKQGRDLCGSMTCPDAGPPEVSFEWVRDLDGSDDTIDHGVVVTVTDDTEIADVSFVFDESNLTLVASDVGMTEATYTFAIFNLTEDSFIRVSATDGCGTPCPSDGQEPVLSLGAPDHGVVSGSFTDATGIVDLDFFFLRNATASSTFDPMGGPQNVISFTVSREDPGQEARFGILAADFCNAYVLDPIIPAAAARGGSAVGAGSARGVIPAAQPAQAAKSAAGVPDVFALEANYPNPFTTSTRIRFDLPEAAEVRLVVYDVLGREVRVLADAWYDAGSHEVTLDARDLPSGTYVYRLNAGSAQAARRLAVQR